MALPDVLLRITYPSTPGRRLSQRTKLAAIIRKGDMFNTPVVLCTVFAQLFFRQGGPWMRYWETAVKIQIRVPARFSY